MARVMIDYSGVYRRVRRDIIDALDHLAEVVEAEPDYKSNRPPIWYSLKAAKNIIDDLIGE